MNKPLNDWALGKLKEYCNGRRCDECKFGTDEYECILLSTDLPSKWGLFEPPRWTEEDIEDAKAVKRVFKWATHAYRFPADGCNCDAVYIHDAAKTLTKYIDAALFPGLKRGETVTLQEILDAEEK